MYALVQLEHFLAERVLTSLPQLKRTARESGMRRSTYSLELDRWLDWSIQVQDARLYRTFPISPSCGANFGARRPPAHHAIHESA